ncbi:MAG: TspO/MBR family protein [Ferruginibacter sp.]
MNKLYVKVLVCVAVCLGLGTASGFSTASSINGWYQTIQKPSWNPPNWIFGPVWTVLYILMGIAAALVWHSRSADKKIALALFAFQFVLNLLWTYIFFGMHNLQLALIEIMLLSVSIAITLYWFLKVNKTAAVLLLPYLMWVSFASSLTYTIFIMNS